MEGHDRELDREPEEEREEEERLDDRRKGPGRGVDGREVKGGGAGVEDQRQQADQHDDRGDVGVDEEFHRGVAAVRSPPVADDEEHRHEDGLPEEEEQEDVERNEDAETSEAREHDEAEVSGRSSGLSPRV